MGNVKVLKGDVIYTKTPEKFETVKDGFIVVEDTKVVGVYDKVPAEYEKNEILDYTGKLIIPGFVDLHVHAPQFENRGIGYDKELLPWLETYTFPEESKFANKEYAEKIYKDFVQNIWDNGTTRAVTFATLHREAAEILSDLFIKAGIGAYVGKVNMDRNSPDILVETTKDSLENTEKFIKEYSNKSDLVKPIITPRFVPTCSDELMTGLGEIAKKYSVPVQSHLDENKGEIEWVSFLAPDAKNYSDAYDRFDLFGTTPTIMAHCVYCNDDEEKLIKDNGVFVAHCPESNIDLSSGIAPILKYMKQGINVGLGSDVSGGHSIAMNKSIVSAIQSSKLYSLYVDNQYGNMTLSEGFYLGTKGGGKFFGNVGSFESGFEFDALIIDDSKIKGENDRNLQERLEKFIFVGDDRQIKNRFVAGNEVKNPNFK